MAIFETNTIDPKAPKMLPHPFLDQVFTATFALGVATGITMEFSFGTNWADYARFVGDIFGAPLAAEALLAFSWNRYSLACPVRAQEGKRQVLPCFRLACLAGFVPSALWIIIANSWMQTRQAPSFLQTAPRHS